MQAKKMQKLLLICGIASSLFYVFMNVLGTIFYKGYDAASQTVSELSAIGAPTRPLWISLAAIYSLLSIGFALGVWRFAIGHRTLQTIGILLLANGVIGLFWPPMHQRQVLANGGKTITDTLHIVFTIATTFFMMLVIILGAVAFKKWFRIYSVATLMILIVFGALTAKDSSGIEQNLPTPLIGIWERINIGIYLLWIIVLAIVLLSRENEKGNKISIS